jgi:hypothetical protein
LRVGEARVVDENIYGAKRLGDGGNTRHDSVTVGDVERHGHGLAAVRDNRVANGVRAHGVLVARCHTGSRSRERPCYCPVRCSALRQ